MVTPEKAGVVVTEVTEEAGAVVTEVTEEAGTVVREATEEAEAVMDTEEAEAVMDTEEAEAVMDTEEAEAVVDTEEAEVVVDTEEAEVVVEQNLSGQTQEMINQLTGQPDIVVVSGVDSDTATIVSLQSPNLSSSSSGWNPNMTLDERMNEEKIGSLRPSTHLRGSRIRPSWLLRLNLNSVDESEEAETVVTPEKAGVVVTEVRVEAEAATGTQQEAEAVVRPPEKAGTERRSSKKAGTVVGPTEEAGAVVGPTEEAEGAASKGGTLKRGRGNRRTAQTGPEQVSDNVSGKERAGGKGNPKRKRSDLDDTSVPPKRIKKCRAVHGVEQKELWCRPCINSKKCEKYT